MKHFTLSILLLLVFSFYSAGQVKKIFIADDDHTDFMWTANEETYDSAMIHVLDYYLDQIDSTRFFPQDFQARYNCDAAYWMRAYERFRSPGQFNRLVKAIRSGHISVPLNYLVSTYGAQPTEAVIRGMFSAGRLQKLYDLDFPIAVAMENQTLPLGLSSLWAGSGARYSWRGICGCATRLPDWKFKQRKNQLYHYTGPDGASVIMKWYNRSVNTMHPGGYAEMRGQRNPDNPLEEMKKIVKALDLLIDTSNTFSNYPYTIAGAFGYGWDNLETYAAPLFISAARQTTTPSMAVRVSNEVDFFQAVEDKYPNLSKESLSYGNEWDLYSASMQEPTAAVRRALEKLRSAEAMFTLVALKNKKFGKTFSAQRLSAWEAYGKYWEHNWTADGPITRQERAVWQLGLSRQIAAYSDTLFSKSAKELAKLIPKGNNKRFYVFNPLSWARNDIADLKYDETAPVKVIDVATGKEVLSQFIQKGKQKYLRIFAEEVPSVGFKVFEIINGTPLDNKPAAKLENGYFSNQRYQIKFNSSGAIISLVDKLTKKEFVSPAEGKYFNDLGANDTTKYFQPILESQGPVSATVLIKSDDPVPHSVRVTLFSGIDRIQIWNGIRANFADVKTWAFSTNLVKPATHHEELGAILLADKKSNGGDYADNSARYDWQTFNHFADLTDAEAGITISNLDCSFFKLGNSRSDSFCSNSPQLNALAGGQIDRYKDNDGDSIKMGIYNQFGQEYFEYHFAVNCHNAPFNALSSMKFSLEHQNPLVAEYVTGERPAYPANYSLLKIDDPEVLLWSIKPSEEGIEKGIILRAWNFNKQQTQPDFQFSRNLAGVRQTTHLERDLKPLKVNGQKFSPVFVPHQINTYRVNIQ